MEPQAYVIEPADVAQLRAISIRLGEPQMLTQDQRRHMGDLISLVVSRLTPWPPPGV